MWKLKRTKILEELINRLGFKIEWKGSKYGYIVEENGGGNMPARNWRVKELTKIVDLLLEKEKLVECITPNKASWRVYSITQLGKEILKDKVKGDKLI